MKIYKWKCDVCGKEFEYAGVIRYSIKISVDSCEDYYLPKEIDAQDICSDCKNKIFAALVPYFHMY